MIREETGGYWNKNQITAKILRRITDFRNLFDFFFDLRLAIVSPPAIQAMKSGLDPLCLVRPARARTTTTSRAANMQSEPLHCRPIQLAVSPDDAYKPRKTGLCKNQVTLKSLVPPFSLLNGYTKLLRNILCQDSFFNSKTKFRSPKIQEPWRTSNFIIAAIIIGI